jgi:hypothetical protein
LGFSLHISIDKGAKNLLEELPEAGLGKINTLSCEAVGKNLEKRQNSAFEVARVDCRCLLDDFAEDLVHLSIEVQSQAFDNNVSYILAFF